MQFTYPNVLWALLLLLIPIIVHLLQLRRFKKTPFTNVRLLQKVVAKSRKSQTLKKYLLLASRLLFLTALVLAFAQPFLAGDTEFKSRELVVYLDNSFSMDTPSENGTILQESVQGFLEQIPGESEFHLFTNNQTFPATRLRLVQDPLLQIRPSAQQLSLEEIYLKAGSLFSSDTTTRKDLVVISDFQYNLEAGDAGAPENFNVYAVVAKLQEHSNVSIDSAYIMSESGSIMELTALLRADNKESIPVSLYNGSRLIAKTAAEFNESDRASLSFTIPSDESLLGRISIVDNSMGYDNNLYITANLGEKVRVLGISAAYAGFLERIYTEDEFIYDQSSPEQLNYSTIDTYNLIVLNQLPELSAALQNALRSFRSNGGSLLIIPPDEPDLISYNQFLANWGTQFTQSMESAAKVTTIAYNHPLYSNVFEKRVENFQFPDVAKRLQVSTRLAPVLAYQNGESFLAGINGLYLFTAALDAGNTNFQGSPLIVPTLYGIGKESLKLPELYYLLGSQVRVDVAVSVAEDEILKIVQDDYEFIPRQQAFANKVNLSFSEPPDRDGIYAILSKQDTLRYLSVNYPREESLQQYDPVPDYAIADSLDAVFDRIENQGRITTLWKWFVILALVFILAEVFIQKFLP